MLREKGVAGLRKKCHGANDAVECRFSVLHFESRDSDVLRDRAEDAFGVDWFVPDVATLPLDSQSCGSFPMV